MGENQVNINDIAVIFISIILEAIPFLLLGSIISALIQEFVSDATLKKIIPKNPILASFVGVLLGFFIPACDCAVIPVALRLLKKKVPVNVCVSFMLASPIINPVTLASTIYAFRSTEPKLILYRIVGGVVIAMIVGLVVRLLTNPDDILKENSDNLEGCSCSHSCTCDHEHHANKKHSKMYHVLIHSKEEFLDIMRYLLLGALITALIQVLIVKLNIQITNINSAFQNGVMMIFAYILSLCSTADVFVAKTFLYEVNNSAILAFLILGPMIDIKNTIVLLQRCNKKFVLKLILLIFITIFILTSIIKL